MATRDLPRAARAIDEFLDAMGLSGDPSIVGTGARVAEAWDSELLAGTEVDVARLFADEAWVTSKPGALVVLREVSVATTCPHHLMPALGEATIAYLPGRKVAGLGTLARALHALARRLTLQEELGQRVVDALHEHLHARGAACRLRLRHSCLAARGERERAIVETIAASGTMAPGGEDSALLSLALGPG
ncbi:MAG: GTP cyclohydrolase I [Polyangiaceae bacterium]|nr:GTP cyclohydrolase I [Polyangiaceae bacterium]